ncbi:MAG: penicillin acylase family protein [Rhodothermia bacterium]|nr:MAG: penicillin acylase family protein [Rhodothermia bacterium]
MTGKVVRLIASILGLSAFLVVLNVPIEGRFAIGPILEPVDGLYKTARNADNLGSNVLELPTLGADVRIIRDERGVPHIFASSDRDAVIAFGYVVAQDRLFQIDFLSRAASGELSAALGRSALETDQFFRRIGMRWTTERDAEWLAEKGDEHFDLITWYQAGANAYIDSLEPSDDPFEFRILGYRPRRLTTADAISVLLYMSYDLSFTSKDQSYQRLRNAFSEDDYERLFPRFSKYVVPIIPEDESAAGSVSSVLDDRRTPPVADSATVSRTDIGADDFESPSSDFAEGLIPGKGSNNWAVSGSRSTTGYPILAGDMHLNLSVPAIWYEAHLVTPEMNVYGVTIPGAPVIIEGITEQTAWAFTNTGSDQIDYYDLELSDDRAGYIIDGEFEPFETIVEDIIVAGDEPVADTLYISRFGPTTLRAGRARAIRWAAHDTSRTLYAVWEMGRAGNYSEFQDATRSWDSPMQNILYADRSGTIAIRSTGFMPTRKGDHGAETLDGTTLDHTWNGRIPFDELPSSKNPSQGYLTSTNQQPTAEGYPYYLGRDWRDAYRSIRINELLQSSEQHSVQDFQDYQADVHAVQADLFVPLLSEVLELSAGATEIRDLLLSWNGETSVDQIEPILFHEYLTQLEQLAWDEAAFQTIRMPSTTRLFRLLTEEPESIWLDIVSTTERENATILMGEALERAANKYGEALEGDRTSLLWGSNHQLTIRHITRSRFLRPIWRGPYPYPGYRETLSPAASMSSTSSASWRVVVDFSTEPPTAFGVYPGGQSGNPFSERYDNFIDTYLKFEYYSLFLPDSPEDFKENTVLHELRLVSPASG